MPAAAMVTLDDIIRGLTGAPRGPRGEIRYLCINVFADDVLDLVESREVPGLFGPKKPAGPDLVYALHRKVTHGFSDYVERFQVVLDPERGVLRVGWSDGDWYPDSATRLGRGLGLMAVKVAQTKKGGCVGDILGMLCGDTIGASAARLVWPVVFENCRWEVYGADEGGGGLLGWMKEHLLPPVPDLETEDIIGRCKRAIAAAHRPAAPAVTLPLDDLVQMQSELKRLGAREAELLAHNTRLHDERIAWDRRHQVRAFHQRIGVFNPEGPTVPTDAALERRVRLMVEEFREVMNELCTYGWHVSNFEEVAGYADTYEARKCHDVDIAHLARELADLDYVIEGTRLELGIDGTPVARLVHEANMRKESGGDGKKAVKPAGWVEPDVASEIERQRRGG